MTAADEQRQAAVALAREAPAESIIALAGLFSELCGVFYGPSKNHTKLSRDAFSSMAQRHGLVMANPYTGDDGFTPLGDTVFSIGSQKGMREVVL